MYVRITETVELANVFLLVLLQLLHFSDDISFRLGLCCNVTPSNNEDSVCVWGVSPKCPRMVLF